MAANDDENVVDRADLLMQRRRSFVATPTPATPVAESKAAKFADVVEDDDVPVLTEVLTAEPASAVSPTSVGETLPRLIADDLRQAIERRLDLELPRLVEASVVCLEQDLRRGMLAAIDAALEELRGSSR